MNHHQAKPSSVARKQPCHVLLISNHWDVPGGAPFIDRQVDSLVAAGVKVSKFNLGTSHSVLHLFRKWRDLRDEARRLNPVLVHARYGTIVAALAVLSGRPALITFNGSDLLAGASVSPLRTHLGIFLSNAAAFAAKGIICVSEELRQALWWRRDRAVVIPDGIDLNLFSPGPQDEARKRLGWNVDAPVILFNAKRDPRNKGLDLAEAAFDILRSRLPVAKLHVVSKVEPGLMPLYYRAADVLLCTSKQEGSPNVIKEALACNLPVVSVPVGDVRERLSNVCPSAVVSRDSDAISSALMDILSKRERSNGREQVEHLSLESIAKRVEAVYRSIGCESRDPGT